MISCYARNKDLENDESGKEVNKQFIILHPDTSIEPGARNSGGAEEAKADGNQF